MPAQRIVVRGRVQGVGFRAYVQRIAEELGAAGEVWNRRDGDVELVARHDDESQLQELIRRIRQGPGRVDGVNLYAEPDGNQTGFRVGYTR